jgi:hypothetical protein
MSQPRLGVTIAAVALFVSACGRTPDERACGLAEDLPARVGQASLEEVQEVAQAARDADSEELRTIGVELASNLTRRRALENLAPGSFLDVIQANLDHLRRACGDLQTTDEGST